MAAITAFQGSTLGMLALMIVHAGWNHRHLRTARCLLLFLACVAAYVLLQMLPPPALGVETILVLLGVALPGAFWVFCLALFRDRQRLAAYQRALIATYTTLAMAGHVVFTLRSTVPDWVAFTTFQLPQLLKILILASTLFVIAADWRTDLVEPRRRLRLVLLAVVGVYCIGVVSAELILYQQQQQPPAWLILLHSGAAALLTLLAALWLIRLPSGELEQALGGATVTVSDGPAAATPRASAANQVRLDALRREMSESRTYRENGLTIGQLAQRLGIQEHRLRQLINRELGYRNFTEFLNSYRLEEAAGRLRDPAQAHLPILSIALECGYASLPPFNRAFKARFGMTPSQFRQPSGAP